MDSRFDIEHEAIVLYNQYIEVSQDLVESINEVRGGTIPIVCLTADARDYQGAGSLSIPTYESIKANSRRMPVSLSELSISLWNQSFKRNLVLRDSDDNSGFMISLSNERREPEKLFFYGQCLDKECKEVLDSYKKVSKGQSLGDGFPVTSSYAASHAVKRFLPNHKKRFSWF